MSDQTPHGRSSPGPPTLGVDNTPDRGTGLGLNSMQGQFHAEHFQASAFPGQRGSAGEFAIVSGNYGNQPTHYPHARTSAVPNIPNTNPQEQDQFRGYNMMFAMPDQRSLSPNIRHGPSYHLFNQNLFVNNSSPTQDTPPNGNHYLPHLSPAFPHPANRSSFAREQAQPSSSSSQQPVPFWGFKFKNIESVHTYLGEVAWFPSMDRHGFPKTPEQYKFYLEKICMALKNIQHVWDLETAPWQFSKFMPNGEWTDPQDIEAIGHYVMFTAMKIHLSGVTDFAQRRSIDYMSCNADDIDFTFPQRIHFVAHLLNHSKAAAAEVMAKVNVDKYVATPITALRAMQFFERKWSKASPKERQSWTEVSPYIGSGVTHPSQEEKERLAAIALSRYQQAYAARMKREAAMDLIGNSRSQATGQQDGGMAQGYSAAANSEGRKSPSIQGTNMNQVWAQPNAHIALSANSDPFLGATPNLGQSLGEGTNSPDIPDV